MKTDRPNTPQKFETARDLQSAYLSGRRPFLTWSAHALRRFNTMKAQGLTADEVSDAVCTPTRIGFSRQYNTVLLQADRVTLSVAVGENDGWPVVLTVLWATADDWQDSYRRGAVEGRAPRADLSHLPRRNGGNR
jgi:hypothetical protein